MITPEELHILFHSLGLDDNGHGREYRNHFATHPDYNDGKMCQHLCELGFMKDHGEQSMWGGMHCYCVTDEGKGFARSKAKPLPILTKSQQRYRDFLHADSGMKFGEWLKHRAMQAKRKRTCKHLFAVADFINHHESERL